MLYGKVLLLACLVGLSQAVHAAEPAPVEALDEASDAENLERTDSAAQDLSDLECVITRDVETLVSDREALENEVASLVEEISKQEKLCRSVTDTLTCLRAASRKAATCGFPIDVAGQSMTEEQLLSAIRQNLAKRKGYDATLVRLRQVLAQAEAEIANAAVLSNFMDAQRPATAVDVCLMRLASRRYDSLAKLAALDRRLASEFDAQKPHPFAAVEQLTRDVNRPSRWLVSTDEVAQFMNQSKTRTLRPEIEEELDLGPKSNSRSDVKSNTGRKPCPPTTSTQRKSQCDVPLLFARP